MRKIREKSIRASVQQVAMANFDVLSHLYSECIKAVPNAQIVTISVREIYDDDDET